MGGGRSRDGEELMMGITIEAGKYYRTRDGEVIGPMEFTGDPPGADRWRAGLHGDVSFWNDNGAHWADGVERGTDLVAEWHPAPDVTKALAEALDGMVVWHGKRGDDDALLPAKEQPREVGDAMRALALYREGRS
jgi:hypothetical protein